MNLWTDFWSLKVGKQNIQAPKKVRLPSEQETSMSKPHPDMEIYRTEAKISTVLTNPSRLAIIEFLKDGEKTVMAIAKAIGARQPNTSRHLAYMKKRGIVKTRKASTSIYYRLASPKIAQASDLLKELMKEQLAKKE